MRKTIVWLLVLTGLLALTLSACGGDKGKQQQGEADKLTLAVPRKSFGYLPLYVGISKGFFKEEGIDLSVIEFKPTESVAALVSGDIDISAAGTSIMRGAAQGAPVKAIMFYYDRASWQFVGQKNFKSINELKGKVIGVDSIGSQTQFAAKTALAASGLDPEKDVTWVAVGSGSQSFAAMDSGTISATMLNVDEAAVLEQKGFSMLLSTGELMPTPFSGFGVTDKRIQENRDLLKRWIRAQVKSLIYTRDNPKEVAEIAANEFKMDPAVATKAVNLAIKAIASGVPGGADTDGLQKLIDQDIVGPLKLKKEEIPLNKITDLSIWEEVAREFKK